MSGRVVLHDDPVGLTKPPRAVSNLRQDAAFVESSVNPDVEVRVRVRTDWSDDGDPLFEWSSLVFGEAIVWEERDELDEVAGVVRVAASCVLAYDGEVVVTESAAVLKAGVPWRVRGVRQFPDRLEFDLLAIEDVDG